MWRCRFNKIENVNNLAEKKNIKPKKKEVKETKKLKKDIKKIKTKKKPRTLWVRRKKKIKSSL